MAVNAAKREIDDASSALEAKRVEGGPTAADVLDSEEHQLLQTLKASKIKFRRYIICTQPRFAALPSTMSAFQSGVQYGVCLTPVCELSGRHHQAYNHTDCTSSRCCQTQWRLPGDLPQTGNACTLHRHTQMFVHAAATSMSSRRCSHRCQALRRQKQPPAKVSLMVSALGMLPTMVLQHPTWLTW